MTMSAMDIIVAIILLLMFGGMAARIWFGDRRKTKSAENPRKPAGRASQPTRAT
jgi:hypothetical protein